MVRKTPIMGWASWNCYRTHISEDIIKKQAETLVQSGLADCGYQYINIDDGFFGGRDEEGNVKIHPERFPNGLKVVADYIHSLGLKAGTYSDAGDNTCGYYADHEGKNGENVGLYQHERQDLYNYLVNWGFDFIKVDWCGGLRLGLDEEEQYSKIGNIIQEIRDTYQKDIVYNVCRWQFPGSWVCSVADSWRVAGDITPNFNSILHQLDMVKPLRKFCSPGHVNDLDMLQIGNGMTVKEDLTHFVMWCMLSTPLMIGCDLTKLDKERLDFLTNKELIEIHQDNACLQGYVVKNTEEYEIWIKNLGKDDSNTKAVVFLNRSDKKMNISCSLEELGLSTNSNKEVIIRDLIDRVDIDFNGSFDFEVEPHCCKALKVWAPDSMPVKDCFEPIVEIEFERVTLDQIDMNDIVLIDVRSEEEYNRNHLEGAINIPYTGIHDEANRHLNKDDKVVLYCTTGKRSLQAANTLLYLGYKYIQILSR